MMYARKVATTHASSRMFSSLREKVIEFNSCREVAASKVTSYRYRRLKRGGIDVRVKYVDTSEQINNNHRATVLALHGAPGSYHDFNDIIEQLTLEGCRVIAPNLPDIKLTHSSKVYFHSTEEKYEILTDFLREINAPTIDTAIVHSAGVYSAMKLWYERPEFIRSLVLLHPSGHRRCKGMKPALAIDTLARLNLSCTGRLLWRHAGVAILKLLGHAAKISPQETDSSLNALLGMHMAGVERLEKYLQHLQERQTPTVMIISDRDKLIDWDISLEMIAMLGACEDNINILPLQGEIVKEGKMTDTLCLKY